MKQFEKIEPAKVSQDPRIVAKLVNSDVTEGSWYFLLDNSHIIIASTEYFTNLKTGEQEWLSHQTVIPKNGIVWFCDSINNKFFKSAAEGGLPKGKFGIVELIEGERLKIYRAANAGGPGMPGYTLTTLDRMGERSSFANACNLSDQLLFEEGLFAVFEEVAEKVRSGVL